MWSKIARDEPCRKSKSDIPRAPLWDKTKYRFGQSESVARLNIQVCRIGSILETVQRPGHVFPICRSVKKPYSKFFEARSIRCSVLMAPRQPKKDTTAWLISLR